LKKLNFETETGFYKVKAKITVKVYNTIIFLKKIETALSWWIEYALIGCYSEVAVIGLENTASYW
jgi:hypothetical protein